jgi:DNA-binding FrmR family transcriptional regulator
LLHFQIVSSTDEGVKRMARTTKHEEKLLNRVRRIRGRISAIEKALDGDQKCSKVHNHAACRGATDGLMAEVMEGHVCYHVINRKVSRPQSKRRPQKNSSKL